MPVIFVGIDLYKTGAGIKGRFCTKKGGSEYVLAAGDNQGFPVRSFMSGMAFKEALGDKKGVHRYGDTVLPMDESLILTAVDFSGRSFLGYDMEPLTEKVGDFDTELAEEFWMGFVRQAECAVHIRRLSGKNTHHILEGSFKSMGRSLRMAVAIDPEFKDEIPSTKGVL